MRYDYLVVGDKRPNIAGNIYTENTEGINVHKYYDMDATIDSALRMSKSKL